MRTKTDVIGLTLLVKKLSATVTSTVLNTRTKMDVLGVQDYCVIYHARVLTSEERETKRERQKERDKKRETKTFTNTL